MTGNNSQLGGDQSQPLKLLTLVEPHECSYLPDQMANSIFIDPTTIPGWGQYSQLSRAGFRRSGTHFYRPNCPDCNACKSSRVLAGQFTASRRFKRILKRNADLSAILKPAHFSDEHYELFQRYIHQRHQDGDMYPTSEQQFRDFLCSEQDYAYFVEFRLEGRLIACSVIDVLDDGISAIYTYFDPAEEKRSLGTLAVLWQIGYAQQVGLTYVYLGYWIKNCQKMRYKDQYQPLELFIDDNWQPLTMIEPTQR